MSDETNNYTSSEETEGPDVDNVINTLSLELYTIFGLLSVLTDVILVVTIVKFKRLRRETTHVILAHSCVFEAVFCLVTPVNLQIFYYVTNFDQAAVTAYCIFTEIEVAVMICLYLFSILLLTDWYLKVYKKDDYDKFVRHCPFIIGVLYLIVLCLSIVGVNCCITESLSTQTFVISFYVVLTVLLIYMIYLIVLNIVHQLNKRSVEHMSSGFNLGLIVCNISMVAAVPSLILMILAITYVNNPLLQLFLEIIGFTSSIISTVYLYVYARDFNIFLRRVVTCKCNEYKNECLDEPSVVYNSDRNIL